MRFVSYNVEGLRRGAQVAQVLRRLRADVVGLQEPGRGPLGRVRVALLARRTGLRPVVLGGPAGTTALLVASHVEVDQVFRLRLPRERATWRRPLPMGRGASGATVDGIQVLVLHLPLRASSRAAHLDLLAGRWGAEGPRVVMGDLNERPGRPSWQRLTATLTDLAAGAGSTFPAGTPDVRIDAVLGSSRLRLRRAWVPDDDEAREASDHRPVVVDLELDPAARPGADPAGADGDR
ncbi:MAG: endonuclease/exonuclease/phosphatase family protein [Micrococcales bacterium]|nr:endonuclease/exonuclease/phosphatase family protein [Micrococcales bacterium]